MTAESERRLNPLTGEWVLVSTGRQKRPWSGFVENVAQSRDIPVYVDDCALCPGNNRAKGQRNPDYRGSYVFENDFPALTDKVEGNRQEDSNELFISHVEQGECSVVCFSENHGLTLAKMNTEEASAVVEGFQNETARLAESANTHHIQIFENRGEAMGHSSPHPHAQIWAQHRLPSLPAKEFASMQEYRRSHSSNLLMDYVVEECRRQERVVVDNGEFVVLVPFWATWPFETLIVPKRRYSWLTSFSTDVCEAFADAIRQITIRYDNLFETDFPYSAGIHQQAVNMAEDPSYQLHMHFYPPLLRSATIRKFMVGYEMLAEPQRDLSAEEAASHLRDQSGVHYLGRDSSFT